MALCLPQLAGRFLDLTLEALPKLATIGHSSKDASPFRCVWVRVNTIDGSVLPRLAAPPI